MSDFVLSRFVFGPVWTQGVVRPSSYPKDFTPGCTTQSCSFRDNYETIRQKGAIIIGVSSDDPATHATFRERHALPFPLIADTDGHLRELYDVKGWLPFLPPRVTYVIDERGIICATLRHDLRVRAHVPEVLEALARLDAQPSGHSYSALEASDPGACQWPERPPCFSSRRIPSMRIPRSTALHMS